jgi:pimeloyl-ACP methyl ester carboxylesterase
MQHDEGPWLLLRGLTREARHWGSFPAALERALPGARAFTLDLPGIGTERHRPSPSTISGIADDLRARWAELRASSDRPWRLLAMSLGGMVAADWCARHPEDFSEVVLINSSARDVGHPLQRMQPAVLPRALGTAFARDLVAKERTILEITTSSHGDDAALAQEWAAYAREWPMPRATAVAQLLAAMRFRAPERMPIRSLVLTSAGDRLCAPICSRRLAARFSSDFDEHPSAGHDLPLDDPRWVTERISRWLALGRSAA